MSRLRAIPIVLALLSASCSATYPAAPDPVIVALQVFYSRPMSYALTGTNYSFNAYAIRSDGAYLDVTSTATWLSSDLQIMRSLSTAGSFSAVSAGRVDIAARYQSMLGVLSLPVLRSDRLTYPRLTVAGGDPRTAGMMASISLSLDQSATASQSITNLVTWTSADPSIVRVDGASVTAVQVGTTVLSTTYNGLTVEYGLSVHPSK